METLNQWLDGANAAVAPFLPRLAAALAILVVAWLVAKGVRAAVLRLVTAYNLDQRLGSPGLGASLAGVGSALVWLLSLPALLGTLELQGLLEPVNAMLSRLLGFVPNLMGAVIVAGIGLLVARIARQLVTALLKSAGSERAAEKMGMQAALGKGGLAGVAGNVVFVLLLLPTLVAALQPLGLDAVTIPLSKLLESMINFVPRLLSAAIVVGLGVLLGRTLATLAAALLAGVGFDRLPARMGAAAGPLGGRQPSEWASLAVMLAVVMAALTQACEILGLPVLTDSVAQIGATLLRLGMAAVILLIGLLLASAAARRIVNPGNESVHPQADPQAHPQAHPQAQLIAMLTRFSILFFAAALALHQAGLPAVIVTIAFGAVVGGIAIGLAVAVGVGGGPVATRLLQRAVDRFDRRDGGREDRHDAGAAPKAPLQP